MRRTPLENGLVGREIGRRVEGHSRSLKLLAENKCRLGQLLARVNEEIGPRMYRRAVILEIGRDLEAAKNVVRLTDPELGRPVPHI
jgi:hypothetical protein